MVVRSLGQPLCHRFFDLRRQQSILSGFKSAQESLDSNPYLGFRSFGAFLCYTWIMGSKFNIFLWDSLGARRGLDPPLKQLQTSTSLT
jgi:hypothetical protein